MVDIKIKKDESYESIISDCIHNTSDFMSKHNGTFGIVGSSISEYIVKKILSYALEGISKSDLLTILLNNDYGYSEDYMRMIEFTEIVCAVMQHVLNMEKMKILIRYNDGMIIIHNNINIDGVKNVIGDVR